MSDKKTVALPAAILRKAQEGNKGGDWVAVPHDRGIVGRLLVRLPRAFRVGLRRLGCKPPLDEFIFGKVGEGKTQFAPDLLEPDKPLVFVDGKSLVISKEYLERNHG